MARRKAEQICKDQGRPPIRACCHVGDTHYDVLAAVDAGVVPIGVTTGIFEEHELSPHLNGTGVILPGLQASICSRVPQLGSPPARLKPVGLVPPFPGRISRLSWRRSASRTESPYDGHVRTRVSCSLSQALD